MTDTTNTQPDRRVFEGFMKRHALLIIGSKDPYPARLEADAWVAWQRIWQALPEVPTVAVPPLPEPEGRIWDRDDAGHAYQKDAGLFTDDQMLAYGDARAAHAVAQRQGKLVGVADTMPGTTGFTMAVFYADQVPLGTPLYTAAPATAKQPAEPREHILSAHIALSTCDGEGRVDKHHVQIAHEHIEVALGCLAATAPAPQVREIIDAEIEVILCDEFGFDPRPRFGITRHNLRRIVRAAIALANGRG